MGRVLFRAVQPDEDEAYETQRQREDDAEADGLQAGRLGLGAGLASEYAGRELQRWMVGFRAGCAERARDSMKARRACLGCDCGGVGRCLDHA